MAVAEFLQQNIPKCLLTPAAVAEVRNKVDGSQTSCPGGESYSELSATGRRADLYSAFGVQRKSRGIYPLINAASVSPLQVVGEES